MKLYKKYQRQSMIAVSLALIVFMLTGFTLTKKKMEAPVSVIMFGDSITNGANWKELLQRKDVKTCGFPGFTTSHLVWLIKENVIDLKPEICFLEGGINDIGVGIPLSRTKANYKKLIDGLLDNHIVAVVQSVLYQQNNPESKIQVDSLNTYLIEYCKTRKVHYLDINGRLSSATGLKAEYTVDGTHLNSVAYKIWAKEVKAILAILRPQ
ncbi:Lysophospholipase L1 [Pedobacter sp. ok626]|uniref:GDSL-type esterase/lipase family protein n=1 Tax=Pedobacter sp. ok626 TaxID=1761882 RepID=UPI000887900F|nr:GDSL-type esterase/lipase family protein [Pedobacter sp. ok626]SDK56154.1 Lysophospholipase L1 [Pedobacter sp. ok626]